MERGPNEKPFLSAHWMVAEVDQIFSRFRRYTQFVLFSKWFLALVAIGLLVSLIAWPLLRKDSSGIRVSFTDSSLPGIKNVAAPVMSSPEYRGVGANGQQFKINGTKATQITPNLIQLDTVEAQLVQQSGNWLALTAKRADYRQDTKVIELTGEVTVMNNQGYTFTSEQAFVDMNTMDMHGEKQVTGVGPLGNLLASGFKMTDNAAHIEFINGGGAQVHLQIERKTKQ